MARLRSLGVCIREGEFSESSQVVTVFTRDHGVVRGLAKGARRTSGSFSSGFELLSLGELLWLPKPAGQLATLTSWSVQATSPAARVSLERWAGAMFLAQLLGALFQEADPHPRTFDRLAESLGAPRFDPPQELLAVLWLALDDAGFRIQLDEDIQARGPLAPGDILSFVSSRGGFTAARFENAWRVRASTLECLRAISADHPGPPETARRAVRLLHAYARDILGRELTSWAALEPHVRDR